MPTFRELYSPANLACQLFECYFACQLRLPTLGSYFACNIPRQLSKSCLSNSRANFFTVTPTAKCSRITSRANFSCQVFESYFTCQLVVPTFRELLRLSNSHASFSRITSPAQLITPALRELLRLPTSPSNFGGVTLPANSPRQLLKSRLSNSHADFFTVTSTAKYSRITSRANFSCQVFESYFTCQLAVPTFRELLRLPTSHANFSRVTSHGNISATLSESEVTYQHLMPTCRE